MLQSICKTIYTKMICKILVSWSTSESVCRDRVIGLKIKVKLLFSKMIKINDQHGAPMRINWIILGFLSYVHLAALPGLYYLTTLKWQTLLLTSQTLFWSAIGVTGGLHRLWSHRSYKAHWSIRSWLMFCTSLANQGTIYHWTRDHRVHHKNSETDADPHNVRYI